jgi:predicted dienelactone hydrolase
MKLVFGLLRHSLPALAIAILLLICLLLSCSSDDKSDDPTASSDDDDDLGSGDDDDSAIDDDDGDDDDDNDTIDIYLPAEEPGPYNVGAFEFFYQYEDKDRTLPGMVWYPTEDQTGETMRYFFGLVRDFGAFKDAEPAEGPFPLIVFSHGNQSVNFQSFNFIDHLVSHGYVVAACSHLQNTALTYLRPSYFAKIALDRPQDISALIDVMLAKNDNEASRLYGRMDPSRIGVFGHSFGGYTSIATLVGPIIDADYYVEKCEELGPGAWHGEWNRCVDLMSSDMSYVEDCPCTLGDPRIKVAVPMAPAHSYFIVPGSLEEIAVPTLIMAGELDAITPPATQNRLYFEGMTHPETLYWEMAGASHYTFSIGCEIPIARPFFPCTEEYIDHSRATPLIRTALTAFLGLHLLNDERYQYYFENEYLITAPEITLETK